MTTKSFTPIFVPTDKPSNLILDNNKLGLTEIIHANKCHSNCNAVNQILLLIDQEAEIKDGDYCAALDTKIIFKAGSFDMEGIKKFKHLYKKIIATSLLDQYSSLPSINQSDIQWMVEEYNKNGKLPDKVAVEMEVPSASFGSWVGNTLGLGTLIRTNPDGSIRIVKPIEEKVDVESWDDIFKKADKYAEDNGDNTPLESYLYNNYHPPIPIKDNVKQYSSEDVFDILERYRLFVHSNGLNAITLTKFIEQNI